MSAYRRNILVGVVVLGAITVFGWMVLHFSSKTAALFAPPQFMVHFQSTRADGISEGSSVEYLGVNVGHVTSVKRRRDGTGVDIDALVDRSPPLPANLRGRIAQSNPIGGSSNVDLELEGVAIQGELRPDAELPASYVGLQLNLLPPSISQTAVQIGVMSDEIARTMRELRESGVSSDLDIAVRQVNSQALKLGQVLDSFQSLLADPQIRQNYQTIVANFRATSEASTRISANLETLTHSLQRDSDEASDTLKTTQQHVDQISRKLGDTLAQLSAIMGTVQDITQKIDQGKGTVGQLLNDQQLYLSMTDSFKKLDLTVGDLKRVIDQWEQEGVTLRVKP